MVSLGLGPEPRPFNPTSKPGAPSSTSGPPRARLPEVSLLGHRRRGAATGRGGGQTLHRAGLDVEELAVKDHPPRLQGDGTRSGWLVAGVDCGSGSGWLVIFFHSPGFWLLVGAWKIHIYVLQWIALGLTLILFET